jgi:outer membrane protein assembly factor BamD (BamD/ComL family)
LKKADEEKQLKVITDNFGKGIQAFNKKDISAAQEIFAKIVSDYEDSEYYSVLEVHARARVYHKLAESILHPVRVKLKEDLDYLNEGIFQLNAGDFESAQKMFSHLESKKYHDPYLQYLQAVLSVKKGEEEEAVQYLKKCIAKDEFFKILAYNEPDFSPLFEKDDFLALVE